VNADLHIELNKTGRERENKRTVTSGIHCWPQVEN